MLGKKQTSRVILGLASDSTGPANAVGAPRRAGRSNGRLTRAAIDRAAMGHAAVDRAAVKFDAAGAPDELQFGARVRKPQGLVEAEIGQRQGELLRLGGLQRQLYKTRCRKHHLRANPVIAQVKRGVWGQPGAVAALLAAGQGEGLEAKPSSRSS